VKRKKITFTRSRAYRKNDQAHVEEKNGSVVRRLVGHDRYEGTDAWRALTALYAVLRLYVNFFQPSVKLLSKEQKEGRTTKRSLFEAFQPNIDEIRHLHRLPVWTSPFLCNASQQK